MIALDELEAILGADNVLTGDDITMRSVRWGSNVPCLAHALVKPGNTSEVSALVRACAKAGQKIVVHGGRTGMAGGAVATSSDIVLSLERMNAIETVDIKNRTMLVGAGTTIQQVQECAADNDYLFAIDFGARGSATVGGAIATNAGGNRVLRFGMMREQVLGLEVVLADGTVVDGLKGLIKDNSGYDLKQLFIGSEGTLGIVTRAVLRLRSRPVSRDTALLAFDDFDAIIHFLRWIEGRLSGALNAFEVMWRSFFEIVTSRAGPPSGLSNDAPFYVLIESEGGDVELDRQIFQTALEEALKKGLFTDAVIAKSEAERAALWALRDDIDTLFRIGDHIDLDVSVPMTSMKNYATNLQLELARVCPDAQCIVFGHIADNNLHVMVVRAERFSKTEQAAIKEAVYRPLAQLRGSISAEHGIGVDKKEALSITRSAAEIMIMKRIKTALDPHALLNGGKIFDLENE